MFSPSVNKHFPAGTSPYSPATQVAKANVTVHRDVLDSFDAAKRVLNVSYYTSVYTKREYLHDGLIPLQQRLFDVQAEYGVLYDAYEKLLASHKNLVAATSDLIADVEEEHKLNAAKAELLAHIASARDVASLPVMRPQMSVPEPAADPARVVTPSASPARAEPKMEDREDPSLLSTSEEEKPATVPKAEVRVKFQDNYPDLSEAFDSALNLKRV